MSMQFDRLPVEILHMIFEFMSNCDALYSFYNINPYLNAVLNGYSWHTLNFQSISKCCFDAVCNDLKVERILSLTLSNDFNTPEQVQIFFCRFNLQTFINLRCLTILSVTNEEISFLLIGLSKLPYLSSLFTNCRSSQPLRLGQTLNQMKSLQNLSVSHGDIFDHNVPYPLHNLKFLDAGSCHFLELRRLQMIVPSLISLKITLQANHQLELLTDMHIWSCLERLDLTLDGDVMATFDKMQRFLLRFINLKYLTLHLRGMANQLVNGNDWKTCPIINHLRKFDFIFNFKNPLTDSSRIMDEIFSSFATSFWRDEKKWYVVVTTHNIYTISCFNNQVYFPSTSPPLSTSLDDRWFYSTVKRIKIDKTTSSIDLERFRNLESLEFSEENLFRSIENINLFTHLRHLIFHQPVSNITIGNILKHNLHINHLTLSQNDFHQLSPLKTIHYLTLQDSIKLSNRKQIKALCQVFPSVKRLVVSLHSIQLVYQIINGFHHLENGVFHFHKIIKPILYEWLMENTRLVEHTCSYTYRNDSNQFLIWINNSTIPTVPLKDKVSTPENSIQDQRSDKCLLQ